MNRLITAACAVTALATSSACSITESNDTSASGGSGTVNVSSSAETCDLTATKAPAGNVVFKVKNTGEEVTEFYLYAEDGMRIVGEIENVGPGLSRDLVVRAAPGSYVASCRPGMIGKGIRSEFTVSDSGKDTSIKGVDQADIDAATTQYAAYVKDQSSQLVDETALGRLDAGLFFIAFVRNPDEHYTPMQTKLSSRDGLMEYLQHTGSGLFAVPPGVRAKDGFIGETLFVQASVSNNI